jgi:hypothetical protein
MKFLCSLLLITAVLHASAQSNSPHDSLTVNTSGAPGVLPKEKPIPGCGYAYRRSDPVVYIIDICTPAIHIQSQGRPVRLLLHPGQYIMDRDQLMHLPVSSLSDVVSLFPGVYQRRRGDEVSIFGARTTATEWLIDGMRMAGR